MGNSAFIQAKGQNKGVYLHWNGGRDSVEAFLKYCDMRGFRSFNGSDGYGMARFCQVVGNFFGADGLSIGIEDNGSGDNGVYIVDGWNIVERDYKGFEQNEYNLQEMLIAIDEAQPQKQQLGDFLKAEEMLTNEVKIGDAVYVKEVNGTYTAQEVIGIGQDRWVNGTVVLNMPYVNRWCKDDPENNINNYVTTEIVKVKR